MLGRKTRHVVGHLSIALVAATLTGRGWAQDDFFDDEISGSTSSATTDDLFPSDPGTTADDSGVVEGQMTPEQAQAQVTQYLQQAQQQLEQEDWTGALETFQLAREITGPGHAYVAYGIGVCHAELGSHDLAIASLSGALIAPYAANTPGLATSARQYLGKVYLATGKYRDAYKELGSAAQDDPNNAETNMLYGKASLRVALTSPTTGSGVSAAGQSQLNQAIQSLTRAITQQDDFGEAYLERGRALLRIRQPDFALEDLQEAARHMGPGSEASADLGIAYFSRASQAGIMPDADGAKILSDLRAAISAMDDYVESASIGVRVAPWDFSDPLSQTAESVILSRADARIRLANELANEDSQALYDLAIRDAERVLQVESLGEEQKARSHYLRGLGLRMKDDLDGAINAFTKAVQVYLLAGSTHSEALLRRGICFFHQGKLELASRDFDAAANNPQNPLSLDPRAMMWSGISLAEQGEYNQAIRSYTRAIRYSPRFTTAFMNRGLAYMNVGRYERAIEDFNAVLRQDPSNSQAMSLREQARRSGQL